MGLKQTQKKSLSKYVLSLGDNVLCLHVSANMFPLKS